MDEALKRRWAKQRTTQHRVFLASFAVALVLDAVLVVVWARFWSQPVVVSAADLPPVSEVREGPALPLELVFGPPVILERNGHRFQESRHLDVRRVLVASADCLDLGKEGPSPYGRVRLHVRRSGRAQVTGLVQSTGTKCGDDVVKTVAGWLWYRWIPNERFPPPVDLIQPVTLVRTDS